MGMLTIVCPSEPGQKRGATMKPHVPIFEVSVEDIAHHNNNIITIIIIIIIIIVLDLVACPVHQASWGLQVDQLFHLINDTV